MPDATCHSEQDPQKLLTRLQQLEDLIENAADAIFLGNQQGDITYANKAAADLCGYTNAEFLGCNIKSLFCDRELENKPLRYDLLAQGITVTTERSLKRKDGSPVVVEMNSRRLLDGTYHTFIRNISARKEIEAALHLSEEKFSRAFTLSPDAIAINRLEDGVYIAINQGFTHILGWTEADVVGRSSLSPELNIWCNPEDRQRLTAALQTAGEVTHFEAPFRSKDGRTVIGQMSARVLEINHEMCLLSVSRDMTERITAQEKQRELEQRFLQTQKLESMGVLAGGIAHDFNNILMAIIGNAELALRRLKPESPAVANLQNIENSATRAADLAKQMLAYSGKGKFVIESLDLNHLIEEMLHILEVSISKKAVLRLNGFQPLPAIDADATQMRQIIMNLVINASEAIGDKSGVIAITTGCMDCDQSYLKGVWLDENLSDGLYVYLEIADTGCGMNKEISAKLFDPFFTTKFTGRGLGLAAVLGIIRGHQGAIKIYSEEGKGSTFKILLPSSNRPAELFNGKKHADDWQGSGTVLLVDDEETVRGIGTEMLKELGFSVITAQDGREALAAFEKHPEISVVILDLTMPHMDGEQCFRELRAIQPDVKVIISSGYNEYEVSQKFVGKGLAGFIQKPYKFSVLQETLITAL